MEITLSDCHHQWFFFSRNIGELTLKIIYFHYLKKCFLDQSIQKRFYLILKKYALVTHHRSPCVSRYTVQPASTSRPVLSSFRKEHNVAHRRGECSLPTSYLVHRRIATRPCASLYDLQSAGRSRPCLGWKQQSVGYRHGEAHIVPRSVATVQSPAWTRLTPIEHSKLTVGACTLSY